MASPGAPARFARAGLLGEALLSIAGLSSVEVGRSHLTGPLISYYLWGLGFQLYAPLNQLDQKFCDTA